MRPIYVSGVDAVALSTLFLLIISSANCTSWEDNEPSDHTLKSAKCIYLERADEDQDNAFIIDNDLECCMCPSGYRYAGICDASHPNTTQCVPCENGTHVRYGPHLQKECTQKQKIDCPPTMVYRAGSATEEDRCACQPGFIKIGQSLCFSVPISTTSTVTKTVPTTTPHTVSSTIKRTSSKKPTRNSEPNNRSVPTRATLLIRITSPSVVLQDPVEPDKTFEQLPTTDQSKQRPNLFTGGSTWVFEDYNPKDIKDNGSLVVVVACSLAGSVALCVIGILVCKKYNIGPCQRDRKRDSGDDISPLASLSPLLPQVPKLSQGDHAHHEPSEQMSEEPGTLTAAGAIRGSLHHNRMEGDQHLHRADNLQQNEARSQGNLRPAQNCGQEVRMMEAERNRKFMKKVAVKFGAEIPKNEAMAIFRHILGDKNDDQELQSIYDQFKNNGKEMIYRFMLLAIQRIGKFLTPEYLMDKLEHSDTSLQRLVEIVEDEMKEPYMRNEARNT